MIYTAREASKTRPWPYSSPVSVAMPPAPLMELRTFGCSQQSVWRSVEACPRKWTSRHQTKRDLDLSLPPLRRHSDEPLPARASRRSWAIGFACGLIGPKAMSSCPERRPCMALPRAQGRSPSLACSKLLALKVLVSRQALHGCLGSYDKVMSHLGPRTTAWRAS